MAASRKRPPRIRLCLANAVILMALVACANPARYELDQGQAPGVEPVSLIILRDTEAGVEAGIAPSRGGELSSLRVRYGQELLETLYLGRDYTPRDGWTGKAPLLWPATGRNFPADLVERRKAGEVFHGGAWEMAGAALSDAHSRLRARLRLEGPKQHCGAARSPGSARVGGYP